MVSAAAAAAAIKFVVVGPAAILSFSSGSLGESGRPPAGQWSSTVRMWLKRAMYPAFLL